MAAGDDRSRHAPSNAKLAERTARIEEQLGHVGETVDRIENRLDEQHSDLVDDVEDNGQKVTKMWSIYRAGRWIVPIGVGAAGSIVAVI